MRPPLAHPGAGEANSVCLTKLRSSPDFCFNELLKEESGIQARLTVDGLIGTKTVEAACLAVAASSTLCPFASLGFKSKFLKLWFATVAKQSNSSEWSISMASALTSRFH
ncbi:hypothetical protein V6N13_035807 [Hibiscus sabdariffa]|uniref:Uncharacterized protein n=1 Tax=Hibiscus sabdariffa TaxID=183260 RepID=A0ABR2S8A7_9ROSI